MNTMATDGMWAEIGRQSVLTPKPFQRNLTFHGEDKRSTGPAMNKPLITLSRANAQKDIDDLREWACEWFVDLQNSDSPKTSTNFSRMHILVAVDRLSQLNKLTDRLGMLAWMPFFTALTPILDMTMVPLGRRFKAKYMDKISPEYSKKSFPYTRRLFHGCQSVMKSGVLSEGAFWQQWQGYLHKQFFSEKNTQNQDAKTWFSERDQEVRALFNQVKEAGLVEAYPEFELIGLSEKGKQVLNSLDLSIYPFNRNLYHLDF
jgi:hypothetical protein